MDRGATEAGFDDCEPVVPLAGALLVVGRVDVGAAREGVGVGEGARVAAAAGLWLGAWVAAGAGAVVGVGVGVGVGAGVGRRSGMMRGPIGTPARSSAGPCGTGVGVGEGVGREKPPGEFCADKGDTAEKLLAIVKASAPTPKANPIRTRMRGKRGPLVSASG